MNNDVAAEIAACLENVPGQDAATDEVKRWLFTAQNSVAVRLCRILEGDDKTARHLLTERAARTWGRVTDPEGKAKRLWARLSAELVPIAKSESKWLQEKVNANPKNVLAGLFSPKHTCRDVALMLWGWTRKPLAVKADLIVPYHGLVLGDKVVWNWTNWPYAGAVEVPPVGDFLAAMVMNRLRMMVCLTGHLGVMSDDGALLLPLVGQNKKVVLARADWEHDLDDKLLAVRNDIYDTSDAQERAGAMALLQVYLALEKYQPSFEPNWSVVIPWPADDENMSSFIIDRREQIDSVPDGALTENRLYLPRSRALGYTFDIALKDRPGDVVSIVKGGLEWLAGQLGDETAEDARPTDLMATTLVLDKYVVSRATLRRAVKDHRLKDWRKPGAKKNATLLFSDAEVKRWYDLRKQ